MLHLAESLRKSILNQEHSCVENSAQYLDYNTTIQLVFLCNDPLNSMEIFKWSNHLDVLIVNVQPLPNDCSDLMSTSKMHF